MFQGMEILMFVVIIGFLAAALAVVLFFVAVFSSPPGVATPPRTNSTSEQMDEGDMHSGPEGYSANTAYPETQYGSMFDEEADWNEEER
jgi:hypothetical protein